MRTERAGYPPVAQRVAVTARRWYTLIQQCTPEGRRRAPCQPGPGLGGNFPPSGSVFAPLRSQVHHSYRSPQINANPSFTV